MSTDCSGSIIFPPPPPSSVLDLSDPLVIGVLSTAVILVSYYAFASRYCNRRAAAGIQSQPHDSAGIDDALIKTIHVSKYLKRDGGGFRSDHCSVCLGEFQEEESLRVLPKCYHAFHLSCIDTWLKNRATCPLCRSGIDPTVEKRRSDEVVVEVGDLERVVER